MFSIVDVQCGHSMWKVVDFGSVVLRGRYLSLQLWSTKHCHGIRGIITEHSPSNNVDPSSCGISGHCITGDLAWDNRCISGFHFFVGRINNQFIIRRWRLLVITLACFKVSLQALLFSLLTKQAFDLI